jgi:hypothetical protein
MHTMARHAGTVVLLESAKPMLSTVKGLALLGSLHTLLGQEDLASLYFGMSVQAARELLPLHLS